MSVLGIDLGTSSVKAVLASPRGEVRATAAAAYPILRPHPGWAQTDPGDWWNAVRQAVREVLALVPGDPPAAIGLSGQMHGVVLCRASGVPVRDAVLWADSRAGAELGRYRRLPPPVLARLANPLTPGMAGPILAWLQAHEPGVVRQAAYALQPKDWVRARLTGRFASEPSDASATLLFDVLHRCWDDAVARDLGVRRELLPDLADFSGAAAGELLPSAAAELGLPAGIPVAAGAADTAAAALGSGLTGTGAVQLTIGTGVQIVTPIAAPDAGSLEDHPVTHRYRAATRDGWYAMGASLTGGQTLDWVRRMLGATWPELYGAATRGPQDGDPVFLPFLIGERTPYLDTAMRGAWTGLDARHDRSALLYSALEGVAFAAAEVFDALAAVHPVQREVRLAGGGTVAPGWRQLLADAAGVVIRPVDVPEASGRGAALLAAQSAGLLDEAALHESSRPEPGEAVVPGARAQALLGRRQEYRSAVARLYPDPSRSSAPG